MDTMNIGINITRSFLKYAYVLIQSIMENNQDSRVELYVFSGNIEEEDLRDMRALVRIWGGEIHLIKVEESLIRKIFKSPVPEHPLYMHTFYFMFSLLPAHVDRLLIMDGDMVVKKSIKELYHMDFGGDYAICSNGDCIWEEQNAWKKTFTKLGASFFSMVVVLFDVKAIRRDFTLKDIAWADAKVRAVFGRSNEEWGFALLFGRKIHYISEQKYALYINGVNLGKFVGLDTVAIVQDAVGIHYFKNHPWAMPYGTMQGYWWHYAKMSPYYAAFQHEARAAALREHWLEMTPRAAAEEFFLDAFTRTFAGCEKKRILLYGVGGKTESLLKNLTGWTFVGVMDRAPLPEFTQIYGHRLWEKEELDGQVDMIIVVARLCYFDEITQRIRRDPLLNQYPVYYLDGRKIC